MPIYNADEGLSYSSDMIGRRIILLTFKKPYRTFNQKIMKESSSTDRKAGNIGLTSFDSHMLHNKTTMGILYIWRLNF